MENPLVDARKIKAEIRQRVLAKRGALKIECRVEKSLLAAESAAEKIQFEPGTPISAFFPIRSEIDPRPLMDMLIGRGAVICLPAVVDKTTIEFRKLERDADLEDTGFGTRGPGKAAEVIDPRIMLVPLAVFDMNGGRIGYGAGYYDRAISRLRKLGLGPTTIGMAFDCQCHEPLPQQAHDVALDAIVTESGFHRFGQSGQD